MNKILDVIMSEDGSISTMRVAVLLVIGAEVFKNVYLTVHTGTYVPIEVSDAVVVVGALMAKAVQRPFETKVLPKL